MSSGLLMSIKDKIPNESIYFMQDKLENIDDKKANHLSMLNLKDPKIGLILGIFLGMLGVDRFYKGDIGLGILKAVTFGGLFIWAIIDWFVVPKGIRKDNLEKINQIL